MSKNSRDCEYCNHRRMCSMFSMQRNRWLKVGDLTPTNDHPEFLSMSKETSDIVLEYYKKWMSLIKEEENEETNRNEGYADGESKFIQLDGLKYKLMNETETGLLLVLTDHGADRGGNSNKYEEGLLISEGSYVEVCAYNISKMEELRIGSGRVSEKKRKARGVKQGKNRGSGVRAQAEYKTVKYTEYSVQLPHAHLLNYQKNCLGTDITKCAFSMRSRSLTSGTSSIMRTALTSLCTDPAYLSWKHIYIPPAYPTNIISTGPPPQPFEILNTPPQWLSLLLATLNSVQQEAIISAISTQNIHLILGVPGSGKTTTIATLLYILYRLRRKVLVTAYTNSALDTILIKLKEFGAQFIRLGSAGNRNISDILFDHVFDPNALESIEELKALYSSTYIVGCTCYGSLNPFIQGFKYEYCVMDEASQIVEPLSIAPILRSQKVVMIGDHFQLQPLVKSLKAKKEGMGVSFFERLYLIRESQEGKGGVTLLTHQVYIYIYMCVYIYIYVYIYMCIYIYIYIVSNERKYHVVE